MFTDFLFLIGDLLPRVLGELNNIFGFDFLIRSGIFQCVERLDLTGMDFIWRIAMESPDEEIANEAIQLIITYSYTNLNPKMKKVSLPQCIIFFYLKRKFHHHFYFITRYCYYQFITGSPAVDAA